MSNQVINMARRIVALEAEIERLTQERDALLRANEIPRFIESTIGEWKDRAEAAERALAETREALDVWRKRAEACIAMASAEKPPEHVIEAIRALAASAPQEPQPKHPCVDLYSGRPMDDRGRIAPPQEPQPSNVCPCGYDGDEPCNGCPQGCKRRPAGVTGWDHIDKPQEPQP